MSGTTRPEPAGGKQEMPPSDTEAVSGGITDPGGCVPNPWNDTFPPPSPDDMRDPNPCLS